MQDCLAEFPTKVTARATNPPPYSITRLFVPCTSFRFYYSFFFLQPEKCKPLRIPRVYISKRKQQSKHSRLQMRLHLFFKFTTNNWLWTRNDNFFLLEVAAIFFSNWIFHHDYEIKRKSVDVKKVFTQFQKNLDYRRSSRISG